MACGAKLTARWRRRSRCNSKNHERYDHRSSGRTSAAVARPGLVQLADEIRTADVLGEKVGDVLADRRSRLIRREVHGVPHFTCGSGLQESAVAFVRSTHHVVSISPKGRCRCATRRTACTYGARRWFLAMGGKSMSQRGNGFTGDGNLPCLTISPQMGSLLKTANILPCTVIRVSGEFRIGHAGVSIVESPLVATDPRPHDRLIHSHP